MVTHDMRHPIRALIDMFGVAIENIEDVTAKLGSNSLTRLNKNLNL
jgi:hypothetical protein